MKLRYALLVTALLAAAPTQAKTYLITYTGTIDHGQDQTGEFGTPLSNLRGLTFSANYLLSLPHPGASSYDYGSIVSTSGAGPQNPLKGAITINGITQKFTGYTFGNAQHLNNYYGYDEVNHSVEVSYDGGISSSSLLRLSLSSYNDFLHSNFLGHPLSYDFSSGDMAQGYFRIDQPLDTVSRRYAHGQLTPKNVTISAVPEPATWAMLIAGFGLIGGAMRRQRRAASVSYA